MGTNCKATQAGQSLVQVVFLCRFVDETDVTEAMAKGLASPLIKCVEVWEANSYKPCGCPDRHAGKVDGQSLPIFIGTESVEQAFAWLEVNKSRFLFWTCCFRDENTEPGHVAGWCRNGSDYHGG